MAKSFEKYAEERRSRIISALPDDPEYPYRALTKESNLDYIIGYQGTVATSLVGGEVEKDNVNHPTHYTSHPSGVEVIQITEHMNFCLGNAIKYIMRAEHKGRQIEDLKKAAWYINREIERLQNG